MTRSDLQYRLMLTAAAGAMAMTLTPVAAAAAGQDDAVEVADESDTPVEGDAIVVTGSRIDKAGFRAPTPTTVISGGDLLQGARPSIAQVLNDLPQFRATTSPVTNFSGTASGSSPADLRGLGTSRTLTLLNGRRFTGAGDLNTVPQGLIQRVEVVTGGASGLGAATARALAAKGVKVAIFDLQEEKGHRARS